MKTDELRAQVQQDLEGRIPTLRTEIREQAPTYSVAPSLDSCLSDAANRTAALFDSFVIQKLPGLGKAVEKVQEHLGAGTISKAVTEYLRQERAARAELKALRRPVVQKALEQENLRKSAEKELIDLRQEEKHMRFYMTGDEKGKVRIKHPIFVFGMTLLVMVLIALCDVVLNWRVSKSNLGLAAAVVFVTALTFTLVFLALQAGRSQAKKDGAEERAEKGKKAERKQQIGIMGSSEVAGVKATTLKALKNARRDMVIVLVALVLYRLATTIISPRLGIGQLGGTLVLALVEYMSIYLIAAVSPRYERDDIDKWEDLQEQISEAEKHKTPAKAKDSRFGILRMPRVIASANPWEEYVSTMDEAGEKYRTAVKETFQAREAFLENITAIKHAINWLREQWTSKIYHDVVSAHCEGGVHDPKDYQLDAMREAQIDVLFTTFPRFVTIASDDALNSDVNAMDPSLANPPAGRVADLATLDEELRKEIRSANP